MYTTIKYTLNRTKEDGLIKFDNVCNMSRLYISNNELVAVCENKFKKVKIEKQYDRILWLEKNKLFMLVEYETNTCNLMDMDMKIYKEYDLGNHIMDVQLNRDNEIVVMCSKKINIFKLELNDLQLISQINGVHLCNQLCTYNTNIFTLLYDGDAIFNINMDKLKKTISLNKVKI